MAEMKDTENSYGIKYNLLITLTMFFFTLLADVVARKLIDVPMPMFNLYWCILFLFFYCLSFCSKYILIGGYLITWFTESIGLAHWYYFGRIISAHDVIGFVKANNSVLKFSYVIEVWPIVLMMTAVVIAVVLISCLFVNKKTTKNLYLSVCLFIVLYIPITAAISTVKKEWQPNGTVPIISNVIYAVSYYIFFKEQDLAIVKDEYLPYEITKSDIQAKKILFILTDSWSIHHLKENGYPRETMPLLSDRLKNNKYKMYTAIAPSVDTLISVPLIFNAVREPFNQKESLKKLTNLFRIAKQNGYRTHCFTAHASFVFDESGKEYIDNFVSDIQDERDLLLLMKKINFSDDEKDFIVLHYFSAHSPYAENYKREKPKFEHFTPVNILADRDTYIINTYDNNLLYMDSLIDDVLKFFDNNTSLDNSAVFLTADHAEMLGSDDIWGHGYLMLEGAKVPLIIRSKYDSFNEDVLVPHYLMLESISKHLGTDIINPNLQNDDFFINDDYNFIKYKVDGKSTIELLRG